MFTYSSQLLKTKNKKLNGVTGMKPFQKDQCSVGNHKIYELLPLGQFYVFNIRVSTIKNQKEEKYSLNLPVDLLYLC